MVIHRARLGGGGASGTHTPKILNPRNDLDKFPPPCLPPPPQKKAETGRGGENREEGGVYLDQDEDTSASLGAEERGRSRRLRPGSG